MDPLTMASEARQLNSQWELTMADLPLEIIKLIFNDVSFVDKMSMRWSCKFIQSLPMPSFKDVFIKKIFPLLGLPPIEDDSYLSSSCYQDDVNLVNIMMQHVNEVDHLRMKRLRNGLCEAIYQSRAGVSGSFILDCLYGTNFAGDIDFYEPLEPNHPKSFKFGDGTMPMTQFIYQCGFFCRTSALDESVRNFETSLKTDCKPLVQIIQIPIAKSETDRSAIPKFINATFDLDICKNIFNGRTLMVRSWKKLIYRYDYIKCHSACLLGAYANDPIPEDVRLENRRTKYLNRGFNIQAHPRFNEMMEEINQITKTRYPFDGKCCHVGEGIWWERIIDGTLNLDKYAQD
ncbi:Hypothetical protein POVR1_LOCUS134 [uncultured virus]|nr:Hypothetical protein POVR1_LOCUS134 [uncultured virus]